MKSSDGAHVLFAKSVWNSDPLGHLDRPLRASWRPIPQAEQQGAGGQHQHGSHSEDAHLARHS